MLCGVGLSSFFWTFVAGYVASLLTIAGLWWRGRRAAQKTRKD